MENLDFNFRWDDNGNAYLTSFTKLKISIFDGENGNERSEAYFQTKVSNLVASRGKLLSHIIPFMIILWTSSVFEAACLLCKCNAHKSFWITFTEFDVLGKEINWKNENSYHISEHPCKVWLSMCEEFCTRRISWNAKICKIEE